MTSNENDDCKYLFDFVFYFENKAFNIICVINKQI